ncbi:glutamine--tRNA ligase [Buchnera aphidicola]|uniref:glutamine--tRNA ligase n=1 Tax=Buchnera aphidicola TaxID=9 RepID=UPI003463B6E7
MKFNQSNNNFINKIIIQDIKKKNISIRTRFPPDPNGYLHIGHAKSICLNFGIAKQYNGKCNLRFDDTNPNNNHTKYIQAIKKDIIWLGFNWYKKIRYTSMYFKEIYQYAIELIKKNLAYVEKLKKYEIRKYRGTLKTTGINSPYRNQSIEENLLLFENMKLGNIREGDACLRAKISMKSPLIIMRDPVLYRIKFIKHHYTQNTWCIYPTYDFAHCISDALEKITHSLCTLEFQDNRKLYNWILKNISIDNHPQQYEYSRLNIEYSILSKRKIQSLINNKIIDTWDDPRILTISGLRRKGYTAESIKNFCKNIGITKQNNLIELSTLESCIKKELNHTAHRTMAILDPIKIILSNIDSQYVETIKVLNHPKNHLLGSRRIIFTKEIYIERSDFQENPSKKYNRLSLGKTVKLKYSYTITAQSIQKDINNHITTIFCKCHKNNPNNDNKYGIIHWISKKNAIKSKFILYNPIFIIKNPEIEKDFLKYINQNSKITKIGFIDLTIPKNTQIHTYQFERIGYFHLDSKLSNKKYLVFNQIVPLKTIWKK